MALKNICSAGRTRGASLVYSSPSCPCSHPPGDVRNERAPAPASRVAKLHFLAGSPLLAAPQPSPAFHTVSPLLCLSAGKPLTLGTSAFFPCPLAAGWASQLRLLAWGHVVCQTGLKKKSKLGPGSCVSSSWAPRTFWKWDQPEVGGLWDPLQVRPPHRALRSTLDH